MINIYDTANKLASEFQETDQFATLKKAIADVKENETSLALYREMEEFQKGILQKQQNGQEMTDDEKAKYQELDQKIQNDPHVKQVIMAEQGIYMLLDDIQKTIAKPITDLYEDISIHSGK